MAESVLDTALIVRRRTELGLSQRSLAAECGFTTAAMSHLERGRNHEELTLRKLHRLAAALAVPMQTLLVPPETSGSEPGVDDQRLEALLVEIGQAVPRELIALALRWDLERTTRALRKLRDRLTGSGVVLHRASSGYSLRPRTELLTDEERRELERIRLQTRQLRAPGMRLLLEVVRGTLRPDWDQRAGNNERVNMRMLIGAGIVEQGAGGYRPSADLQRSLGIHCPDDRRGYTTADTAS